MHIRCERCSTVYELEEEILPPGGAPVQCSRCQHVFHASPPGDGKTRSRLPAASATAAASPDPAAAAPAPAPAVSPPGPAALARDGRGATASTPGPLIPSRRTWMWLGLLVVAGGVVAGALWHVSRRIAPAAVARREEGLRLLLRDDRQSLEQAAEVLSDASRLDPRLFQARADRALALTLLAADEREGAAGLAGQAFADLERLAGPHQGDPAVARARALHYVLDGDVDLASRVVRDARAAGLTDPWLDLANGAADVVTAGSEPARQRAVARLAPLAAAHPDLLRARMLLARAEVDLGRTDAAVAVLDGVLEANPGHEAARELKERILQPPALDPARPSVPQGAPPPGRPGLLPRKPGGGQP